jgi:hypothetical protein
MGFSHLFYPWGFIFQALAIIHFIRRRPDGFWLWIILIGGALGAFVYFVAEVVPDFGLLRVSFQRAGRRRRIAELDAIVKENSAIGNVEELADLCFDDKQFARARELYDKVLASPQVTSVDPYYKRGLAALELGDAAAAVKDIETVVSKEPKYDFHRAAGLLAHAYALSGRADLALRHFEAATAASTLSETYYNYATFLAAEQRQADAREWAQRILNKKATMPRFAQRRERPWFRKAAAFVKKMNSKPAGGNPPAA